MPIETQFKKSQLNVWFEQFFRSIMSIAFSQYLRGENLKNNT